MRLGLAPSTIPSSGTWLTERSRRKIPKISGKNAWKASVLAITVVAVGLTGAILHYLSRQARRLTNKDTIVLADFANSAGDPVFDDALKTALTISLRQSPFLNVLSDGEVANTLQQMTRPASTKLTPEVARELVCGQARV
jgi:eukaryotic-like serine/threonine-protein kinase